MTDPLKQLGSAMPPQNHDAPSPSRRPSLLPAFEPFSSSPVGLPRPPKRKLDDLIEDHKYYPTPVPTSSTGILPSSSPPRQTRPALHRAVSTLSERAPLGDVPSLDLPASGEAVLMGRSSNSSDYQLSANRHISRVHIRARYHAPTPDHPNGKVEVACLGWNGAKVHCRGEIVELAKNQVFVSDKPMAQIIVDVQDTRVMLVWPKDESREPASTEPPSPWLMAESPSKRRATPAMASSPPAFLLRHPSSPVSPTPANLTSTFTSTFHCDDQDDGLVKVYEDHSSDEDVLQDITPELPAVETPSKKPTSADCDVGVSRSSLSSEAEEFSEHDEENDPIVLSFGPNGDNILSRFQSFQPTSPERKRTPLKQSTNSPVRNNAAPRIDPSPVKNHVINQLAFSRVHSLPLSVIHSNLPEELRRVAAKPTDVAEAAPLSASELKAILSDTSCVGEISREGKDAAGKLLESEFYYVPENDVNETRREAVTQSLGKTSIRAARKQHKVRGCLSLVVH